MPDKKAQRLAKLFELMEGEFVTPGKFKKFIETIIELVGKIDKRILSDLESMNNNLSKTSKNIEDTSTANFDVVKKTTDKIIDERLKPIIDGRVSEVKKTINDLLKKEIKRMSGRVVNLEKIEPLNEDEFIERVKGEVPKTKDDLTELNNEIRDSLESLEGDKRLDASAIKGLSKRFKESEDKMGSAFSGSPTNYQFQYFADNETPVGTVNGTNKDFTINNIPNPAVSLAVYVNGQRMTLTEDYTYADQTISFVTAPPTTSILKVDYRI